MNKSVYRMGIWNEGSYSGNNVYMIEGIQMMGIESVLRS